MKHVQRKVVPKVTDETNTANRANASHKESLKSDESSKCKRCVGAYPHKESCPARNIKCNSCGKLNHFASICRTTLPGSVKHRRGRQRVRSRRKETTYVQIGDRRRTPRTDAGFWSFS